MTIEVMFIFGGVNLLITGVTALVATRRASAVSGERWGHLQATLDAIKEQLAATKMDITGMTRRIEIHADKIQHQEVLCARAHGGHMGVVA